MSEKLIIDHCSPTLAGIKTANLFNCPCENRKELNDTLRELNTRLVPKGLRIVPVKYMENRALIYIYRPEKLKSDLENAEADALLREKCYPTGNADKCVAELVRRFRSRAVFLMRSDCFWVMSRRTLTASYTSVPVKQSTAECGRYTAIPRKRKNALMYTENAQSCIRMPIQGTIQLTDWS